LSVWSRCVPRHAQVKAAPGTPNVTGSESQPLDVDVPCKWTKPRARRPGTAAFV
jgi:hypothetical protein